MSDADKAWLIDALTALDAGLRGMEGVASLRVHFAGWVFSWIGWTGNEVWRWERIVDQQDLGALRWCDGTEYGVSMVEEVLAERKKVLARQ
jgi:hypothetical protein